MRMNLRRSAINHACGSISPTTIAHKSPSLHPAVGDRPQIWRGLDRAHLYFAGEVGDKPHVVIGIAVANGGYNRSWSAINHGVVAAG